MLTIKCAYCKTKLYKYLKIGKGKVLRCHKDRIKKIYNMPIIDGEDVKCPNCEKTFAKNTEKFFDMNKDGFTYTGTKRNG